MTMKEEIKNLIEKALKDLQIGGIPSSPEVLVESPKEKSHGDYSCNIAMILAKQLGKSPNEIAKSIISQINYSNIPQNYGIDRVEVVGGFINFYLSKEYLQKQVAEILKQKEKFGKNDNLKNKKVILDYTDPNIFKEFHIGHLMNNVIGESLARIFEFQGAKVKRACYQSDVGMGIAKAIWGILQNKNNFPKELVSLSERMKFLGGAYAEGSGKFESNENAKKEIIEINKKIFEKSDKEINKYYDIGKKWSLEHFNELYKKLGTKFDYFIFESQVADLGKKTVEKGLKSGIFEKGQDGAIIFRGEKFGLHTRVFINAKGLPTYEAKDLGLAQIKYKKYKYDISVIPTGNEVNEYFNVMLCAMAQVLPELAKKTKHIGHGMLRLPEGKMSSRTGKVITGESLLEKLQGIVQNKIKDKDFLGKEKQKIAEVVAVGAIKYSALKQLIGSDIIYDFDKSISFEGDSGPYLQYSFARVQSVLRKAKQEKIKVSFKRMPNTISLLEKMFCQFPEIVKKAGKEQEPHFIVLYLTELAGAFNNYYAKNKIVDKTDEFSPYKIALAEAFSIIMENGLWLLGIQTLKKM